MEIKTKLANSSNFTKGRNTSIKYIVIHFTANNGDTAKGNCNYFQGTNRNASAHYFVDENEIYQSVLDTDTAWHCGSNKYYHSYCRNSNSIGVELCSRIDSKGKYYFKDETVNNAIELVKQLMIKYKLPIENIIRHYDVTHKVCPAPFIDNRKAWENFKNRLVSKEDNNSKEDTKLVETIKMMINGKEYYVDRILKNNMNYICLNSLKQAGFSIGYNERTKEPSLGNTIDDTDLIINGKEKNVERVMINDNNYCKLRDVVKAFDKNIEYDEFNKVSVIKD